MLRKQYREYSKQNPEKMRAKASARRALISGATASWDVELTDLVLIEAATLATLREKVCGFAWHIDHVIPLKGKTVCGLHVWNNLNVVPAAFNVKKVNKFSPEFDGRPWL